jgi:uncharacterized Fe-S cluster-containing MiaB family protein
LLAVLELAHACCPRLEIICLETRFETVSLERLLGLQRHFAEWHRHYAAAGRPPRQSPRPCTLQISAGYETQDPYLRNAILWKGYPEEKVQNVFALLARAGERSGDPIWLDEYVMLKPAVGLTTDEAVHEAVETILHLERLGEHFGVPVSVRLNPTFAAVGSELYLQFTQSCYQPPTLRDVYEVLARCHDLGVRVPIFVGLNDEGLTHAQSSFGNRDRTDPHYRGALRAYNAHQDFAQLRRAVRAFELPPPARETQAALRLAGPEVPP